MHLFKPFLSLIMVLAACLLSFDGMAQSDFRNAPMHPSLRSSLTMEGCTVCETTLQDLQQLSENVSEVEVEEMDLGKRCIASDGRYISGKGYASTKFPGMIFQLDQQSDAISKIRLTRDFKGKLPDGHFIDMRSLSLKNVFQMYPELKRSWGSRDCSDYFNFSNDTVSFYVEIDRDKQPQFPVDEAYYSNHPIAAIDLVASCYSINSYGGAAPPEEPVFYIDSMKASKFEVSLYRKEDFLFVSVYKDTTAVRIAGSRAKHGVIYLETKKFVQQRIWNVLQSASPEFTKVIRTVGSDDHIAYVLNGNLVDNEAVSELSKILSAREVRVQMIGRKELRRKYNVVDQSGGVIITCQLNSPGKP